MKTNALIVVALIAVAGWFAWTNSDQMKSIIQEGNVIEQERSVSGFDAIHTSAGVDVYLTQGDAEKVIVRADEKFIDKIRTEVEGNTLKIYPEGKGWNFGRSEMEVKVTVKELTALKGNAGSDISTTNLIKADVLTVEMSAGSDLEMEVEANELDCKLSAGSDAELTGSAAILKVKASAGSDLKAKDFVVEKCMLTASGGSDAWIHVTGELEVEASGASDVHIKGNPNIVKQKSSGGSDIYNR